ncbi:hypothetical protein CDEST_14425 [Colletotrichum destructivum]|uniref:Uncharacterized protein n=1 Tax=Colletotrichum destructivum TaxID=34406 RepID=A0AAX4J1N8_9PEZI|nr:hypothetical protein CDEST_14425 [Colletotrichum destructivum]
MGFLRTLGDKADRFMLHATNAAALSRASNTGGVDCVPAEGLPPRSKGNGQSQPPPRQSKMTWEETLAAEKAAKEKEAALDK